MWFRPLSGIVFSIYYFKDKTYSTTTFPSPLGDCVFNLRSRGALQRRAYRFRPLSGIVVFNLRESFDFKNVNEAVSVPSRGLCFQSGVRGGALTARP